MPSPERYTNRCVECDNVFTETLPCCCSSGYTETPGETLHDDGRCVACCHPERAMRALRAAENKIRDKQLAIIDRILEGMA